MKISKLIPNSIFASKGKDEKVTLFLNKNTSTVCYKNEENEVIEIGSGISEITTLQSEVGNITPTTLVYKAFINQEGTSAPTVNILENTIGDIVWTRAGEGDYLGTLADAFTTLKTVTIPPTYWNTAISVAFPFLCSIGTDNVNEVYITTSKYNNISNQWELSDNYLYDGYSYFEILVYPSV